MKKISKSTLLAILVAASASSFLVACGPRDVKYVTLALTGETVGPESKHIIGGYEQLVRDFNEKNKNNPDFVEIVSEHLASGTLRKKITQNLPLPDLYTTYGDEPATISHINSVKDKIRDMKDSFGENYENFKSELNSQSYLKEGEYNGKQMVLPFGKSVDLSVINVKVLIDVLAKIKFENNSDLNFSKLSNDIKEKFNAFNKEKRSAFLNNKNSNKTLSEHKIFADNFEINITAQDTVLIQGLTKVFADLQIKESENITDTIRSFYNSNSNILTLAKLMNDKVFKVGAISYRDKDNNEMKRVNDKIISTNFSFGMDSIYNNLLSNYASTNQTNIIKTNTNEKATDLEKALFFRTSYDQKTRTGNIFFNKNSKPFNETAELIEGFRTMALENINEEKAKDPSSQFLSFESQWKNTLSLSVNTEKGKQYASASFINGTTFMSSGSSSGAFAFLKKNQEFDKQFVGNSDIIVSSKNNKFISQGPGIAGFKSTGKTKNKKENTVKAFLNFIVQPKEQAHFALRSNYIPSTKSALSIYNSYMNGVVNNFDKNENNVLFNENNKTKLEEIINDINTNSKTKNGEDIKLEDTFKVIRGGTLNNEGVNPPSPQAGKSSIISDFISNFITGKEEDNSSLAALESSPVSVVIRNAVSNTIFGKDSLTDLNIDNHETKNYDKKLSQILEVHKSDYPRYTLQRSIEMQTTDVLKEFKVSEE